MPAWAPQPCSSWGSAPLCHQSRTVSPCQLCVAWGYIRTLSLPLDLSSHSGCPCPLADPGLGLCVGTDLAAALGGPAGIIATSAYAPSLHRESLPQHCAPCQVLPQLAPGFQGGITSLIFLNKKKYYLSLKARISFPAPCMLGLWKASPQVTGVSLLYGHSAVIHHVLAGLWG